ncbi:MAG: bile acid:sodium symporter family protein [Gluconacetobacter diazotrophicus]|nr:bile acid:sodium symporter family protein [Gluconacetobacter diazotrophicus]
MLLRLCTTLTRVYPVLMVLAVLAALQAPAAFRPLAPVVPWLVAAVMFLMGLTTGPADFRLVLSRPLVVGVAVAARYAVMPLVALLVTRALALPPGLAAGFLLTGSCPSAVASNVMTFVSRGNTALSVTVSACNTLLSPLLTPALFLLLAGRSVPVHAGAMFADIARIVLLPVAAGAGLRALLPGPVRRLVPFLPALSTILLLLIVAPGIALNARSFAAVGALAFVGVALHNALGLLAGFAAGRHVLRLPRPDAQAVSFEVGMENTGLAIALVLAAGLDPLAIIPPAIFGAWDNISGAALARFWAARPVDPRSS